MSNSSSLRRSPESICQKLRLEDFLEEFEQIIDFKVVNGERNYRSKWLRGGGKEVLKWLPFCQMHPYLKQVLQFEQKNRKKIFQSECAWNSLFHTGEVSQRLQTLNISKLRKMFQPGALHDQSSSSQFRMPQKKARKIQKMTLKPKLVTSKSKSASKKSKIVSKSKQKRKAKANRNLKKAQSKSSVLLPNLSKVCLEQSEKKQINIKCANSLNKSTCLNKESQEKAQDALEHSIMPFHQTIQLPTQEGNDHSAHEMPNQSIVVVNGEEMSQTPGSPETVPRRPILTDQSEKDSHDEDEQFSYESDQVSQVVNHSQIREFIEVKLKQIQENQNQEFTAKWEFNSQENSVKLEGGDSEGKLLWETPQRKQQSETGIRYKGSRQQEMGLLDVFSDDFSRKIEQLRNVKNCELPESFAGFICSKVLSEEDLAGGVRVNNIISLYNIKDFCYFSVNVGNNYYEDQRFIEYRLLKSKCLPILLRWLHFAQ